MYARRRPSRLAPPDSQGFTLTEILIVMVIVGVLATLAVPSFNELIASQRIKSMASDLNASLTLARSEAIKRNKNVTLSPAGTWQNGWQIADPDNAGVNIEFHEAFTGLTATGPNDVTYRSSGRILGNAAPQFNISGTGTTAQRCVSVDLSGRPYVKAQGC